MQDPHADTLSSEEWYQSIRDASPDAVITMDMQGRVVDWSPQAEEMFGWRKEETVGKPVALLIIPAEQRQAHNEGLARYRETGEGPVVNRRVRLTACHRDGNQFPVELSVKPARIGEKVIFFGFVRDLTEDAVWRQRSHQRASQARLFHQATSQNLDAESVSAALSKCLEIVCSVTSWPVGLVYEPDDRANVLLPSHPYHVVDKQQFEDFRSICLRRTFNRGVGLPGRVWEAGESIWTTTFADDPVLEAEGLEPYEIRGAFAFPVIANGELIAVLEFFSQEPRAPDPQLLMLASSLGSQLGRMAEQQQRDVERMHLAAIVDSSYDAIIGRDSQGIITSWNRGAEQVYGYTAEEALGQPGTMLLVNSTSDEAQELRDAVLHGARITQFETVRRRKDGQLIPVAVTVSPIHDADGRIIGASTIERDISSQQKREHELKTAKENAELANRTKSEFLANISHELRTPMNAIIGMLDLALGEDLSEVMVDYLSTARQSAETLLHLLNDLLDFSRMEAGRFELDEEPFDLQEVVDATMKTLSIRAHEKRLELASHVAPDVPDHLWGDGNRLRQILLNLTSNAIKFTEQGEVVLTVKLNRHEDDVVELSFAVADTGIGISKTDQEEIFRPFMQIDASTTRQQSGTGLGLAICTELTEKMGGRLSLTSELGTGSTFSFTIRCPVVELEQPAEVMVPDLTGLPVLIVDDNLTNRTIIEETLNNWDMQPTAVASGHKAVEELQQAADRGETYPLMIVDALMPDLDGFRLIEKLEEQGMTDTTSILMLSSADRQTFQDRCKTLDVAAFLEKPVSQSDMHDAIMSALNDEFGQQEFTPVSATVDPLKILLAEDTPANQKVMRAILEKRGHEVIIAHNGREAIDLYKQEPFDLILMDIQMPTMDGLQATSAIRDQPTKDRPAIPIIAMTAHARREDRIRCLEAGVDGYLSKPIDAVRLLKVIEKIPAGGYAKPPYQEEPVPSPANTSSKRVELEPLTSDVINLKAALARLGGNRDLLADLAGYFKEDAPELLGELDAALAADNQQDATRAAHSLKGLAANFDAAEAVAVALEIEQLTRAGDLLGAGQLRSRLDHQVDRLADELERAFA